MALKRRLIMLTALAAVLVLTGCTDGGGRGRSASRGRFNIGRKEPSLARANRSKGIDVDSMSPEASMERDLQRLRETEKSQEKLLTQMRGSLDQRSEQVRREEEKLRDIRARIESYDSAIQRHEMAAAPQQPRTASAPRARGRTARSAERLEASSARDNVAVSHTPARRNGYGETTGGYADSGSTFAAYSPDDRAGAEEVLYRPQQSVTHAKIITPSTGGPTRLQQSTPYPEERPAPAVRQPMPEQAVDAWTPPQNLFSKNTAPSEQVMQFKGGAARRQQPAAPIRPAAQPVAPVKPQPQAAPAKKPYKPMPEPPAVKSAAAPAPTAADDGDDDVFTPDLFLSGN